MLSAKTFTLPTSFASVFFLCTISCTNEEYDFSNEIDTSVDIAGDISLPVGSTEFISIGDFLELDPEEGASSVIQVDESGNYCIVIEGENPITQNISVEQITIDSEDMIRNSGFVFSVPIKGHVPGGIDIPDMHITLPAFDDVSTDISIEQNIDEISEIIKALKSVWTDTPVSIRLSLADESGQPVGGNLRINIGSRIVFPSCIVLEKADNSPLYSVINSHIIEFRNMDVASSPSLNLIIKEINLNRLDGEDEGFKHGWLKIHEQLVVSGLSLTFNPVDFASTSEDLPESIMLDMSINVADLSLKGVSAVISPDIDIAIDPVQLGELPEFISGDNVVLDIYNPVIRLDVEAKGNDRTPVEQFPQFMFTADINGKRNGEFTMKEPVRIGSDDPDSPSAVKVKKGRTTIYISRIGTGEGNGDGPHEINRQILDLKVENLSDLMKTVPDEILFDNISVKTPLKGNETDGYLPEDYSSLIFPEYGPLNLDFNLNYGVNTPIAFGKDMKISYSTDIDGWNDMFKPSDGEDMNLSMNEISLKFRFISTIPFNMGISAEAIDTDGKKLSDGITVEMLDMEGNYGSISGGTPDSPAHTELKIRISAEDYALEKFDGLRLNIMATSPDSGLYGVALNKEQGIKLEKIVLNINGGASL